MLNINRSSCASGSGYVPSCSIGFCVANTKNGGSSGLVCPSMVTCRSCIASSSADCVLAGARLISSHRSTCAKTGPGWKRKPPCAGWKTLVPVTSAGIRSGVNWMRLYVPPNTVASVRASIVLATPGGPSSST